MPAFLCYFCALFLFRRINFGRADRLFLCLFLLAGPVLATTINDYDGDHKSDLAIYNESNGYWTILFSSQDFESGAQPILGGIGRKAAPGDYDGDGKTDIAVMSKTGTWWMLLSGTSNSPVSTNFGIAGAGAVPADYDGDGITDLAYYKKASGAWGILYSESGQTITGEWGGPGFIPAPADFDGDGQDDPCLYQESTGQWYILLSGNGYLEVSAIWGGPEYQAAPADYDNDGRADPCVYHRITGEWQILLSGGDYLHSAACIWGNAAHKPVPGDYDGDGRADPMVYADSIPNWQILFSGNGYSDARLPFGGMNWAAVNALWREDLVFMAFGDSITYGDGSSSESPATGYPKLLETKLKQYYEGYFSSINQGRDGEDTYQGFERFAQTLDATNPDLILLMEGTNDHGDNTPFDEIEENLRNMIRIALNRGIPVIIATIPPVIKNQYNDRSAQMARIAAFNPRIYAIAADFNIPVAPVFEAITAVPGWESSLMNQPSANHPNDAGYRIVRDAFYTPISAGLNDGQY
ncbi:MAG: GDSL-type esterase/lipase family protein [Verrucomicrobiota bacterium]